MPAQRVRRVQDSAHGLMEFRGLETVVVEVLRARELQRLRRIRQLGLAHLVFPAAEHSRLVHVIGAAHVAVRFARRLEEATQDLLAGILVPDEDVRRDLAIAALCHDLGHGPLSHVWESEVVREFDRAAWTESLGLSEDPPTRQLKWHELVGQALLAWPEGELHQLLETQEEGTSRRIRALLDGRHYLEYVPRLLAADIDVDRCDFVLRDTRQSGVAYGRYDLNWLISTATLGQRPDGGIVVGFDSRKAPRVVEQFVVARRALYDTVYQHKTVRAAEGMLGLLLRRLREVVSEKGWVFEDADLFAPYRAVLSGEPLTPSQVLALDDYSLWTLIMYIAESDPDETAVDLADRLVRRDLFKQVPVDEQRLTNFLLDEGHDPLHAAVEPYCSGDPRFYIHVDRAPFTMFSENEHEAVYLVDQSSSEGIGVATLARDHPELRQLFVKPAQTTRLFAPREAVKALQATIGT